MGGPVPCRPVPFRPVLCRPVLCRPVPWGAVLTDEGEGEPSQRGAALPALPRAGYGQGRAAARPPPQSVSSRAGRPHDFDGYRQLLAGRRPGTGLRFACARGVDEAVPQSAELEELEQPPQVGHVPATDGRLGRHQGHVQVAHQRYHPGIAADGSLAIDERGAQSRGELVQVGVHTLEVAVGAYQPGRRLLAHAGDPGQVVRRVAPQGGEIRVLGRRHPRAFPDAGLVVEHVVRDAPPVVEDLQVGVLDQLVGVAVARDHDHVVALRRRRGGQGSQDVVGLIAGGLDNRDAHGLHQLADEAHLLAQYVRRRRTGRLVPFHQLVAEGRLGPVEGHRQVVGFVVLDQVHKHRGEPINSVGHLPRSCGQVRGQGEKCPISKGIAVKEHQQSHGPSFPGVRAPFNRLCTLTGCVPPSVELAVDAVGSRDQGGHDEHDHDAGKDEVCLATDQGIDAEDLGHHQQGAGDVERRHSFPWPEGPWPAGP